MKQNPLIQKTAEELGYQKSAIHRENMDEAIAFMEKIVKRIPDENTRHEVLYATQVIVNTLAWEVAEKAVKQQEENNREQ